MGPVLPGGMSLTVKRVPFGGGGVPSWRAPMSSTFSPTGMPAGVRSVHQIRVETPPDFEVRLLVTGPSIRIFAIPFASCPVTTRRIGGCPPVSFVIAWTSGREYAGGFERQAPRDGTMKSFSTPLEIPSLYASACEPSTPDGVGLAAARFEDG